MGWEQMGTMDPLRHQAVFLQRVERQIFAPLPLQSPGPNAHQDPMVPTVWL